MSHQDFELYAKEKPFSAKMPQTWVKAFREVANEFGQPVADLRILDVGCGDGRIYPFLLGEGFFSGNIHGVEVSQARIERSLALGWDNARYIPNGEKLPYADAQFQIINFMEVVEHIPAENTGNVITELHRVLADNGVLLMTTPNYPIKRFYDIYAAVMHGKKGRWKDDVTHVSFYNQQRLLELMQKFFTKIEYRSFKDGFLYKYFRFSFFKHKLFFLCSGKMNAGGTKIESV